MSINKKKFSDRVSIMSSTSRRPQGNLLNEIINEPKLCLPSERKHDWSKKGVINLFDEVANLETLKLHTDRRDVKIFFSEKGSRFQKFLPVIKTEMYFPASIGLEKVINAFHNPKQRVMWDHNLESYSTIRKLGRIALIHE